MRYSSHDLDRIFARTSGKCHICHKYLVRQNYGRSAKENGWEVEHSKARATGGTDRPSNLYPACVQCNRSKGTKKARVARARHGKKRPPLSVQKRKQAKQRQAKAGGALGGILGAALGVGPVGWIGGAIIGTLLGDAKDPDDN